MLECIARPKPAIQRYAIDFDGEWSLRWPFGERGIATARVTALPVRFSVEPLLPLALPSGAAPRLPRVVP